MKKILIPVDFSENAWNAALYAAELYENNVCEFYLLHVFHFDAYTTSNLMAPDIGNPAYKRCSGKASSYDE